MQGQQSRPQYYYDEINCLENVSKSLAFYTMAKNQEPARPTAPQPQWQQRQQAPGFGGRDQDFMRRLEQAEYRDTLSSGRGGQMPPGHGHPSGKWTPQNQYHGMQQQDRFARQPLQQARHNTQTSSIVFG